MPKRPEKSEVGIIFKNLLKMKKQNLFKVKSRLILALLVVFGVSVFISSCDKEESNVTNQNQIYEGNLFNKLISMSKDKAADLVIDKFSETLYSLNVEQITIKDVKNNSVSFEISAGLLFINSEEFNLDKNSYSIEKKEDVYDISKKNSLISVSYNTTNNNIVIKNGNIIKNVDELSETDITPELEKEFITQVAILNEFVITDREIGSKPSSDSEPMAYAYEGTAIGYHLGLADAEYFCQADYNQILEEHPDWWSPGISYSCILDEHFCMCTANFYS